MLARAKQQLRSWMFIYIGLVAAIVLSIQSPGLKAEQRLEGNNLPAVGTAPLVRKDI